MHIYGMQSFTGRNIFSHKPVIKMMIDLDELANCESKHMHGFNEKLLELFPGLKKHICSLGYEGGFVKRLNEGTYFGHIIEHLAIELQCMLGYDVSFGKTRIISEPSLYYIVYEYMDEKSAIECGKAARDIIYCLASSEYLDIDSIINELKKISKQSRMGPSTKAIYDEARSRSIPVTRIGNGGLLQLGYGKYIRLVEASLTDATSCISADIAGNKHLTKQILQDNDIPVPYGDIAYTLESAVALAGDIGYPVVIKPYDSNQGKGVTLDICCEAQVRDAYGEAIKYSRGVIVERFIPGNDYRVLVVGGKVSAVSLRRPPSVTGDGTHTLKELVEIENNSPLRGDDHEKPLTKMKLDNTARLVLSRNGIDEFYIPKQNEVIYLRGNGNLSTGGTASDCSEKIHPYNCYIAIKAARMAGLDIAGVDMTLEDISLPINGNNGAVIEVNAAPGLRMHLFPTEGQAHNVAADIIDMMFPNGRPSSIPIVSITGTNGKTTTTRLVRHILSLTGKKVGMTSTSGIYIGDECVLKGDNTGPVSAKMVLSNKKVEAAVLETARGGIVRKGLGYDMADVGVIVNISEDHIGLDNLNNLEDLAFAKSLVTEAVKPEGYAVLNADDEMVEYLIKRVTCNVVLFSRKGSNPLVMNHIKSGGKAVYVNDSFIFIHDKKKIIPLISLKEIPITIGGIVEFNIENSLAAVSAAYSIHVPVDMIKMGLRSFKPNISLNPGRFNIFDIGDFKVMLDYGHNPAGYKAVIKSVQKMYASRFVGIIGMPGDRLNRNYNEVGEMCSRVFSRIYIKEDNDLRGRKPGEVADIFYKSLIKCGVKEESIEIVYSELRALETAIMNAQPGDLIIMFYEEFEPAVELIERVRQELEQSNVRSEVAN